MPQRLKQAAAALYLNNEGLAEVAQRLKQRVFKMPNGSGCKITKAIDFRGLLCPRNERPSGNTD